MRGLVIVPPLLRYSAGPLLGPALLAAQDGVEVLDLNALWLDGFQVRPPEAGAPVGDHAKDALQMELASRAWRAAVEPALGAAEDGVAAGDDPFWALAYTHAAVDGAAEALARSTVGEAWSASLPTRAPRVVGVSVLWSGQVPGALAISKVCRRRWPDVPVVWGGPHVTALAEAIARDRAYGETVQGFAVGPAERTFELLLADGLGAPGLVRAGSGGWRRAVEDASAIPRFAQLHRYDPTRLTLPVQLGRGCQYGRCRFCTYPVQEGRFRRLPLMAAHATAREARARGARLSFKDAYLLPDQFDQAASIASGLEWSATTRLPPPPTPGRLRELSAAGLRTVELGVESLDPQTLRAVDKAQVEADLEGWLAAAEGLPLSLVLNLMFGFPGQTLDDALGQMAQVQALRRRYPGTHVVTETNLLQVQRRAPLARNSAAFGVRLTGRWPWSATLGWDAPRWRSGFERTVHEHRQVHIG